MTDLYEKSLRTLEFPRVLEMLQAQCVTQEAKDHSARLRPSSDPREVRRLMDETTAARDMMDRHGAPSFSGIKPVAAALQRAELGGMLNNRELLDIAGELDGKYGAKTAASLVREAAEVYEKRGRLKKF